MAVIYNHTPLSWWPRLSQFIFSSMWSYTCLEIRKEQFPCSSFSKATKEWRKGQLNIKETPLSIETATINPPNNDHRTSAHHPAVHYRGDQRSHVIHLLTRWNKKIPLHEHIQSYINFPDNQRDKLKKKKWKWYFQKVLAVWIDIGWSKKTPEPWEIVPIDE